MYTKVDLDSMELYVLVSMCMKYNSYYCQVLSSFVDKEVPTDVWSLASLVSIASDPLARTTSTNQGLILYSYIFTFVYL